MRRFVLMATIICLISGYGSAQLQVANTQNDEVTLRNLERAAQEALKRHDVAFWDHLMASDFSGRVRKNGNQETRQGMLDLLAHPNSHDTREVEQMTIGSIEIHQEIAVVLVHYEPPPGSDFPSLEIIDTFARRDGRWVLLSTKSGQPREASKSVQTAVSSKSDSLFGSVWTCHIKYTEIFDNQFGHREQPYENDSTLTFTGNGTAKMTGYAGFTDVQWRQNGQGITILLGETLNYDLAGTISPDSITGQLAFIRYPNANNSSDHYEGSFECKLKTPGSGTQTAGPPPFGRDDQPVQLTNVRTSTASVIQGDTFTVFFSVHDSTPDVPIKWKLDFPSGVRGVRIDPPDSGRFDSGNFNSAKGAQPSGAQIAVTMEVTDKLPMREAPPNMVLYLEIWKELPTSGGDRRIGMEPPGPHKIYIRADER